MPKRPKKWVPNQPLTTGRLAWLAAKPELERRARRGWSVPLAPFFGVVSRGSLYGPLPATEAGTEIDHEDDNEDQDDRLADYAFPVDRVAGRLNPAEVAALRESGTLPDWFFDAVEKERKADRRNPRLRDPGWG